MSAVRLNSVVRRGTLQCLKGRWGKAVAGTLFLVGVWLLIVLLEQLCLTGLSLMEPGSIRIPFLEVLVTPAQAILSCLFAAASFLVLAPLQMGMQKWFFRLSGGPTPDLRMIFDYLSDFKLYFKTLWLRLAVALRVCLFGAVLSVIPLSLWVAQGMVGRLGTEASAIGQAALLLLMGLTAILGALLLLSFSLRYFLAPYFFAADEAVSVHQAIRQSVKAMKRMKGQVLSLMLGFLPLLLCCLFLAPMLFVIPYCGCAFAINARYLMGRELKVKEHLEQEVSEESPMSTAETVVF